LLSRFVWNGAVRCATIGTQTFGPSPGRNAEDFIMQRSTRRGFTLIEILTVVIILGILAALVVPKMTGFMSDATTSAARSQLSAVRGQIEMYKLRHGGVTPLASGTDGTDELMVGSSRSCSARQYFLTVTPGSMTAQSSSSTMQVLTLCWSQKPQHGDYSAESCEFSHGRPMNHS
jgi:prepilin-type N-terminal cleavage/methylation domain-containing protein